MASEPYGRRKVMPCLHIGEAVVGHFYACLTKGCSGKPACPKCGSTNVYKFVMDGFPESDACRECGRVWARGV